LENYVVMPPGATDVWAEGYLARLNGRYRESNPYLSSTDEREDQWDDGWLFADAEILRGGGGRL
jgi:ribosome modulation factor